MTIEIVCAPLAFNEQSRLAAETAHQMECNCHPDLPDHLEDCAFNGGLEALRDGLDSGLLAVVEVALIERLFRAGLALRDAIKIMEEFPQHTGHHVEKCKADWEDALAAAKAAGFGKVPT